jgi:hypothetical protein
MKPTDFTAEEKKIIVEELEDVRDHYDALIEGQTFAEGVEKEEAIRRVDTIDGILKKV